MTACPALAAALAEFQANLPTVHKSETAKVPTKTGGSYTYAYASLDAVNAATLPALGKVGLSFMSRPTLNAEGRLVLEYELLHTSGESKSGVFPLGSGSLQDTGSALTYARRYVLCALTGVAPTGEDDDGQAAEHLPISAPAAPLLPPVRVWDVAEQEDVFDAWAADIAAATDPAAVAAIGSELLAARRAGAISPETYARLAVLGGRRKTALAQDAAAERIEQSIDGEVNA